MAPSIGNHLTDFWKRDGRHCGLYCVGPGLEVRLYEHGKLIALQPCETRAQALEISEQWRESPPPWPPF